MPYQTTHLLLTVTHRQDVLQPIAEHAAGRVYPIKGVKDCDGAITSQALADVHAERQRQHDKGYDEAHDDKHDMLELGDIVRGFVPGKVDGGCATRDGCVKAAAVLMAMVEKFDREAKAAEACNGETK